MWYIYAPGLMMHQDDHGQRQVSGLDYVVSKGRLLTLCYDDARLQD